MKILVVRFKQIGDSVLAAPICNTLKKTFPNAQVDYVVYEHIGPLFENHKYIDNVITITKEEQKNPFKYIKKVWKVTRNRYDIVIDIMSTPKSELFTLFSLGSKYRIGRYKKNRGYTYNYKITEPQGAKNKIDKFLKMLKPLESEYEVKYTEDFSIAVSEDEKKYMHEKMERAGIDFSRPVLAFAINARVPSKVFNIDKMLKITKEILEDIKPQIIFYYSPAEKEFALEAHKKLGNDPNIFINIETKSIRELAMLFSNCDMFFGNEGGPRHIAHAVGIPTLVACRPNLDIKEWLIQGEKNEHIGPLDVDPNAYTLSAEEQDNLVTVELVVNKFKDFYNRNVKR